jgi:hypothetical protein
VWEAEIEYTQGYVYKYDLVFGASYIIVESQPVLLPTYLKNLRKV